MTENMKWQKINWKFQEVNNKMKETEMRILTEEKSGSLNILKRMEFKRIKEKYRLK